MKSLAARMLGEILLALAACAALAKYLPLMADDPLRSSLVLLPLIVAALHLLGVIAPRRCDASGGEIFALGLLFLSTLARHASGLAATDWLLVSAWMLLLAAAVARRVLAWRPALGKTALPARPPAAFFWLAFVTYLALQPWLSENRPPDGDEPYYLLVAHSLVHDFDADLTNNYADQDSLHFMGRAIEPQAGDPHGEDGAIYSRHNLLLPLALSPIYALGGKHAVLTAMAAMAALLGWMLLRLARHEHWWPEGTVRPGAALLAWAICVFTPPLLLYSYQVWTEVPAALLICIALDRILMLGGSPPERLRDRLGLLLPIFLLPILKLRFGIVAAPLAILAWLGSGGSLDPRRFRRARGPALAMAAALVLGFGGMLVHNHLRYGNALRVYGWHQIFLFTSPENYLLGGLGLFGDAAFGLFFCAPIWCLIVPATVFLTRHRLRLHLALLAAPYLIVAVPRTEWYGGWSPPFRYALIFLPFLALLLMPLLAQRRRTGLRFLWTPLMLATLLMTLLWTAIPGWTYNFADGRTLLLDRASVVLGMDLVRLFPSMVRPRAATWIWPLASLLLIPLAMWRPAARSWEKAAVLGCVALLLASAALPFLTRTLPTTIVEWEDPWVHHEGGQLYPDQWTRERPLYRGGWLTAPKTRMRAAIVPGGARVVLRFSGQTVRDEVAASLRVLAGAREIGVIRLGTEGWYEAEIGPIEWPAGADLVVEGAWPPGGARVIVDRTDLVWE